MSFQSLISGSECAAPANPLNQVLKHTEADRSLQQDRVAGPSSSRLQQLPSSSLAAASSHDLALARQFFEGNNGVPGAFVPPPEISREMSGPNMHDAWIAEQQRNLQHFEANKMQAQWAAEFDATSQVPQNQIPTHSAQHAPPVSSDPQLMPSHMPQTGFYGNYMPRGMYAMGAPQMFQDFAAQQFVDQGKGKGKLREIDFEAAFAQAAASLSSPLERQQETARITEVKDDVADIQQALEGTTLDGEPQTNADFKRVWEHLQNSDAPPPKEDLAKWEAEFNQLMNSERGDDFDYDYGRDMEEAWSNSFNGFPETAFGDTPLKYDNEGLPVLGDYVFETDNKYMDPSASSRSALNDAKALLEQNGSLSEAALLLEAAIQKGDLGEGGYEAWILLGETRNMDEREEAGMRALTEGVRRAEQAGKPGEGMMSLAISYTNESMDKASHVMLLRWLRARFPDFPVPEETIQAMKTHSSWDTHNRISEVFLNLARSQHSQGIMDPDVQIALGVLFYTNGEYDRAKDCFESALSARPNDYLLWNRLGSSLSNGSKPEEALGAYREALSLRPTYTRAIYNVGVACLNIGAHKEAAEHFLSGLALQEQTSGDTSDQLWFTLRRAFLAMDRTDLADLAKRESKTNLDIFRREGFDF